MEINVLRGCGEAGQSGTQGHPGTEQEGLFRRKDVVILRTC